MQNENAFQIKPKHRGSKELFVGELEMIWIIKQVICRYRDVFCILTGMEAQIVAVCCLLCRSPEYKKGGLLVKLNCEQ